MTLKTVQGLVEELKQTLTGDDLVLLDILLQDALKWNAPITVSTKDRRYPFGLVDGQPVNFKVGSIYLMHVIPTDRPGFLKSKNYYPLVEMTSADWEKVIYAMTRDNQKVGAMMVTEMSDTRYVVKDIFTGVVREYDHVDSVATETPESIKNRAMLAKEQSVVDDVAKTGLRTH